MAWVSWDREWPCVSVPIWDYMLEFSGLIFGLLLGWCAIFYVLLQKNE